jgi:crotonobetainyl-CoA:carnitine CoA-transferase CaiB-like acyl-CoA transferase
MVVDCPLPDGSTVRMPGIPMKFSGSGTPQFNAPPTLGLDTDSVLGALLGYSPERVASLRGDRVVQ